MYIQMWRSYGSSCILCVCPHLYVSCILRVCAYTYVHIQIYILRVCAYTYVHKDVEIVRILDEREECVD